MPDSFATARNACRFRGRARPLRLETIAAGQETVPAAGRHARMAGLKLVDWFQTVGVVLVPVRQACDGAEISGDEISFCNSARFGHNDAMGRSVAKTRAHLTRAVLWLLVGAMLSMGQAGAAGLSPDDPAQRIGGRSSDRGTAQLVVSVRVVKAPVQPALPLAEAGTCCICGGPVECDVTPPQAVVARIPRIGPASLGDAHGTPPPHDPPRI